MASKDTGLFGPSSGSTMFGKVKKAKTKPDPLTSVLKSNEKSRAALASLGLDDPTAKPNPSALERIFGVMDIPGVAVRGLIHNAIDTKKPVDVLEEVGKSWRGERRVEGADILGDLGVENKWGKMLGGIAVDIVTDPMTYITAGIGGAGKSAVTSTLDDIVRGTKTLADVGVDATKYADIIDETGHVTDAVNVSKEVAASLYDDVAKALGYKANVKFMGVPVLPTNTNKAGRSVKTLLRGQNERVPEVVNDVLKPLSTWVERGFIHDELTPLFRDGNELVKAFTTMATRRRNAAAHMADQAGEAIAKKIANLIPDERTRDLVSLGIGRQFGDEGNLRQIAKAFDTFQSAQKKLDAARAIGGDALDAAEDAAAIAYAEIGRLRSAFFDPDAVGKTLMEHGIVGDELDTAVEAARSVQAHFDDLFAAKQAAGLEPKALFGAEQATEEAPLSAGYIPGQDIYRYRRGDERKSADLAAELLGVDAGTLKQADNANPFFKRTTTPGVEHSKEYLTPEMRAQGTTLDDLVAGKSGTSDPLRTELDIAKLAGDKTRKDLRDVAYKQYADEVTKVVGDSDEIRETLLKSKDFFTNDEATKGFLKSTDKALNVWRKWATVYNFPMFPARNWLSNKFLMATEGVLDPDAIGAALKIAAHPEDAANVAVNGWKDGAELLDEARRLRVYVGSPETLQLVGEGAIGTGPIGKFEAFAGDINQRFVEDADRLASYIAARRKGLDPEAAAMLVDKALYSYAPEALTVFERNVMRRLTPFYTFTRKNTQHMAELLATKPGALTWIGHAKESGEAATGVDTSIIPDYAKNLFAIPLPTDDKNPLMLSTGGVLPVSDLERVLPFQSPKEMVREQLSSLNPFVRDLLIEFPLNQDIYRDQPIEKYAGEKKRMPEWVERFDDSIADVPIVSEMWEKAKAQLGIVERKSATSAYLAGNAYAVKALSDFVPWMKSVDRLVQEDKSGLVTQLSGVKFIPYDTEGFKRSKAYDDRQMLEDELTRLLAEGTKPASTKKKKATLGTMFGGKK